MMTSLTRNALALALAATVLGMAGCGAGKQAAGGPGGPPLAASAAPAATEQPVMAQPQAPAAGTAAANPGPKPQAEATSQPEAKSQPEALSDAKTKPELKPAANTPVPARQQAPTPASAPAPAKSGDPTPLKFAELYSGASIEQGLQVSAKTQSLGGRRVRMTGYMAPPLKPSLDFFVLTKQPMSMCPFCSSDADWPDDIVLVLVKEKLEAIIPTTPIQVTGVLEVGGKQDPQTGFYSVIRIYADSVKEVR